MGEKIKIGVVGLGIGRNHIANYKKHAGAEVVAICDTDEAKLSRVGDEHGIKNRYKSLGEMLAAHKLDVVSIATPNKFHAPLTIEALKAGCHVLCEKPMAMSAAEGRRMVETAKKTGRRLMINFSYRFMPVSLALKEQVDAGVLGEVYFARSIWHRRWGLPKFGGWFGIKKLSGGGPLIDLGVHRLDLALWLMGYPKPAAVLGSAYDKLAAPAAKAAKVEFDCEDFAVGLVKFKEGMTLELEASWAAHRPEAEFMETWIFGSKGGLVHRNVGGRYEFEAEIFAKEGNSRLAKRIVSFDQKVPSAMEHFVDCILAGKPHMATGEEGVKVMQILDGIYKSAATGKAAIVS